MRNITYFSNRPESIEVKFLNNTEIIYIRENIHYEENEEQSGWVAIEYTEEIVNKNNEINQSMVEAIIEKNTKEEAHKIRKIRDKLLEESDKEVLPDRQNASLWFNYRQALRDIPNQNGFPWDVIWPEKPKENN